MNGNLDNLYNLLCWRKITEFSVGGLLYWGFSRKRSNELLCISTQYASLVNCDTGEITESVANYDETTFTATSPCLLDEIIDIYGEYGGKPIHNTSIGEKISILQHNEYNGNKPITKTQVFFSGLKEDVEISNDYGFYTCSFSPCGNYFVFSEDTGVTIFKRV